ncbi:hypothetical protein [Paenibacillus koleovorans]|uniref:hypothetical protein n=1 Tax=Paenibacillus koleovorans TaxID=121608 RepID=UPI000FD9B1AD|nr:hypothetical protein [Paenibacillus koleovorans]
MSNSVQFANGNDKITVELTVKEALALSGGQRFHPSSNVVLSAKKKLQREIDHVLLPEGEKLHFHSLDI